jgi:hypothetical protein
MDLIGKQCQEETFVGMWLKSPGRVVVTLVLYRRRAFEISRAMPMKSCRPITESEKEIVRRLLI